MKHKISRFPALSLAVVAMLAMLNAPPSTAVAQGTAFTYQGRLNDGGSPASGTYVMFFSLFNTNTSGAPIAGPGAAYAIDVTNGLFTVLIDFGPGVFTGQTNWLEITVGTNGAPSYTTLAPRQQLTPVPYAIYAESAGNLSGTLSAAQLTSIGNTNGGYLYNFFVGPSGNSTMAGGGNTANGAYALAVNTSGSDNAANGGFALRSNTSGSENTANGSITLELNTSGSDNTADGSGALYANTNGSYNTAVGADALELNKSGSNNIALGYLAGYNISTGSSNIDIGNQGFSTDTNVIRIGSGQSQTFIAGVINGNGGGLTNLSAAQLSGTVTGNGGGLTNLNASQLTSIGNTNGATGNFFAGSGAGNTTMSGGVNTGVGSGVLAANLNGVWNTAVGAQALQANTSGARNTASGAKALYSNTNGSDNTASGYAALYSNTSGYDNTASGRDALYHNTIGQYNTASGYQALYSNTTGTENTASGFQSLYTNTNGTENAALGNFALQDNTSGSNNTAVGYGALEYNTSGNYNTACGYESLGNTTASGNTASGAYALEYNTSGSNNTANGYQALQDNTTGNDNTASGYQALQGNTTGYDNTASGNQALQDNTTGNDNTAVGWLAGVNITTGSYNTALGSRALLWMTTGSQNIALGYDAGVGITTGSHNIDIGNIGGDDNYTIRIGSGQTNTYIAGIAENAAGNGYSSVFVNYAGQLGMSTSLSTDGNGNIGINNSNPQFPLDVTGRIHTTTNVLCEGEYWCSLGGYFGGYKAIGVDNVGLIMWATSDERLKQDIAPVPNAVEALKKLRGVTWHWNGTGLQHLTRDTEKQWKSTSGKPEDDQKLWAEKRREATEKLSKLQMGFVAQEVERVFPDWVKTDEQGYKQVDMEHLNAVLVNAIKEQQAQIETQQAVQDRQAAEIQELKARLEKLEQPTSKQTGGGQ